MAAPLPSSSGPLTTVTLGSTVFDISMGTIGTIDDAQKTALAKSVATLFENYKTKYDNDATTPGKSEFDFAKIQNFKITFSIIPKSDSTSGQSLKADTLEIDYEKNEPSPPAPGRPTPSPTPKTEHLITDLKSTDLNLKEVFETAKSVAAVATRIFNKEPSTASITGSRATTGPSAIKRPELPVSMPMPEKKEHPPLDFNKLLPARLNETLYEKQSDKDASHELNELRHLISLHPSLKQTLDTIVNKNKGKEKDLLNPLDLEGLLKREFTEVYKDLPVGSAAGILSDWLLNPTPGETKNPTAIYASLLKLLSLTDKDKIEISGHSMIPFVSGFMPKELNTKLISEGDIIQILTKAANEVAKPFPVKLRHDRDDKVIFADYDSKKAILITPGKDENLGVCIANLLRAKEFTLEDSQETLLIAPQGDNFKLTEVTDIKIPTIKITTSTTPSGSREIKEHANGSFDVSEIIAANIHYQRHSKDKWTRYDEATGTITDKDLDGTTSLTDSIMTSAINRKEIKVSYIRLSKQSPTPRV